MAESLVLQEFLVSLGFKVDEQTFRKFKETLAVINKEALSLGAALVGVAAAVVTATEKTAEQFSKLEFASQRSDTTVKGLNSIAFGFSQIGINADQARGMVENFATLIRIKSGMAEMLTGLGIPEGAPAERFKSLIGFLTQLDKTNEPLAQIYGEQFGLPEPIIRQIGANMEVFPKSIEDFNQQQKDFGIDADKLAKESVKLEQAFGKLEASMMAFWDSIAQEIMPVLTAVVEELNGFLTPKPEDDHSLQSGLYQWFFGTPEKHSEATPKGATPEEASSGETAFVTGDDVKPNARSIMGVLHRAGKTWQQAAAITANLQRENAEFDPALPVLDSNGRMSYGLAQWNSPERLASFKKLYGHNLWEGTILEQLVFLMWELDHNFKQAGADLERFKYDPRAGAFAFSKGFERPRDPFGFEASARANVAADLFARYGQGDVTNNSTSDNSRAVTVNQKIDAHFNGTGPQDSDYMLDSFQRRMFEVNQSMMRYTGFNAPQ